MDSLSHTEFYYGKIDDTMVSDYLKLEDPPSVNYSVAKQPTTPEEVITLAIQEHDIICIALRERRMTLASTMTRRTLIETARRLDLHEPDGVENDGFLTDSMKGPILRTLRERLSPTTSESESAIKGKLEWKLATSDGLSISKIPTLPCNLEDALRFITGDPKVEWEVLELAFLEWLVIKTSPDNDFHESCDTQLLKNSMKELTGVKKQKQFPARKRVSDSIKSCEKALDEQARIQQLRSDFRPGSVVGDTSMHRKATRQRKIRWRKPHCIDPEKLLDLLESDFRGFWKNNASGYLEIFPDYNRKKKAASKLKRAAGKSGVDAREHAKWLNRTTELIDFIGTCDPPKDPECVNQKLDDFAKDRHGLQSPDPREANRLFFQALFAQLPKRPDEVLIRTILDILRPPVSDFDESRNRNVIKRHGRKRNTDTDPEIDKLMAEEQRIEDKKKQSQLKKQRRLFKSLTQKTIRDCYSTLEEFHRLKGRNPR